MSSTLFQHIGLPPAQLKAVEKRAKHAGKTPAEYMRLLVQRDLLAEESFDDILEPVRKEFRKSGVSATQLQATVERTRRARPSGRAN